MLYESTRTRVIRLSGGMILKQRLGPMAASRTRHERVILERLADVPGVAHLVSGPGQPPSVDGTVLIMEDYGGVSLAELLASGPMALPSLIQLAAEISETIARVHHRGVLHRDVNPANILLSTESGQPTLIDFDVATTFAEERVALADRRALVGTLAYLSPEQTGRTGRAVDSRADLYSWGATLFELATGRPPFLGDDFLNLVHQHLTRTPEPLVTINPAIPGTLSRIVARLLEKEPDQRYQSAQGLAYDLRRMGDNLRAGRDEAFDLGSRDFPERLSPPERLVGRGSELAILREGIAGAADGRQRAIVVTGSPGVGKSALVRQLRPVVTSAGGWFVHGVFDPDQQDIAGDGLTQALRGLGRVLLAESPGRLAELRGCLVRALGRNASLMAVMPEYATLLDVPPEEPSADPLRGEARYVRAVLTTLAAVASPSRPVVLFLDNLQWAGTVPLDVLDALVVEPELTGVLAVGALRPAEVGPGHPLSAMISRWSRLGDRQPTTIELANLDQPELGLLLERMLRLAGDSSSELATLIAPRTGGNPLDTVELVNALREDGVLTLAEDGWRWEAESIRRFVGRGEVADLLSARISVLPEATHRTLRTAAYLGNAVELEALGIATGRGATEVEDELTPALEDGLLVLARGEDGDVVRFRHDRVWRAVADTLGTEGAEAHLLIARRLAESGRFSAIAAQQYLSAITASDLAGASGAPSPGDTGHGLGGPVDDPGERRRVATLFHTAAAALWPAIDSLGERYLATARSLLTPIEEPADATLALSLVTAWHRALYGLGRLTEADQAYQEIERRHRDPWELAEPTTIQISSLVNRDRQEEAIDLGLRVLARLGLASDGPLSERDESANAARREALCAWGIGLDLERDLARPEANDPRTAGLAGLANNTLGPSFLAGLRPDVWPGLMLSLERLWDDRGPCAAMIPSLGLLPAMVVSVLGDRSAAYTVAQRVLAIGEAKGFQPQTAWARSFFTGIVQPWFESVRGCAEQTERAREELLRGGETQQVWITHFCSVTYGFELDATLDECAERLRAARAFAERTGNALASAANAVFEQLLLALRGETATPGGFDDDVFRESDHLTLLGGDPIGTVTFHAYRALSSAVFGDSGRLREHSESLMPLLERTPDIYVVALGHLLRAISLVDVIRHTPEERRAPLVRDLERSRDWLVERASHVPENFGHLVCWIDAEYEGVIGDPLAAMAEFDMAVREAASRRRPWHHALIAERAALFCLEHGFEHIGRKLLREAYDAYLSWGAVGKISALRSAHLSLSVLEAPGPTEIDTIAHRTSTGRGEALSVSTETLDLMAVLDASRALSSETSLERLRLRVEEVLSAMTGATGVLVALLDDDTNTWRVLQSSDVETSPTVEEASAQGEFPLSVFFYVERTRQPLLVPDVLADDRFAGEPFLSRLEHCSLLAVPILVHGRLRAVLVLENRLGRDAFASQSLGAVMLIAGQLSVSLDNVLLYTSLERKVSQRTEELRLANERLSRLSMTDPLTGLANRRWLGQALEAEWERARRTGDQIGLMMIDIDHFKWYNDSYGHLAGDACLKRIAAELTAHVRSSDLVARYGGEEFAIVLRGTGVAAQASMAERIRASVEALGEPHPRTPGGVVTISVGVATMVPVGGLSPEMLVQAADGALYQAKSMGRNRVALG